MNKVFTKNFWNNTPTEREFGIIFSSIIGFGSAIVITSLLLMVSFLN